jgi:hypothetical protein
MYSICDNSSSWFLSISSNVARASAIVNVTRASSLSASTSCALFAPSSRSIVKKEDGKTCLPCSIGDLSTMFRIAIESNCIGASFTANTRAHSRTHTHAQARAHTHTQTDTCSRAHTHTHTAKAGDQTMLLYTLQTPLAHSSKTKVRDQPLTTGSNTINISTSIFIHITNKHCLYLYIKHIIVFFILMCKHNKVSC